MDEIFDYDVFLSFASSDAELARPVWQELSLSGLRVFWSDASLKQRLGEQWFDSVESSLERSRHFVVLVSRASMKSEWVKREYQAFYNHCFRAGSRRLIPALVGGHRPSEMPLFLRQLEAVPLDDAKAVRAIAPLLGGTDVEELKRENRRLVQATSKYESEAKVLREELFAARQQQAELVARLADAGTTRTASAEEQIAGQEERRTAFHEFFGGGALSQHPHEDLKHPGVIVLQADLIDTLAGGWTTPNQMDGDNRPYMDGYNRPYKARRWINACDTDGAQAIMHMFAEYSAAIPKLVFHYEGPSEDKSAPFEITMGGFGEKTRGEVNELGKGWIKYEGMEGSGDVLTLHENCGQSGRLYMRKRTGGFRFVLPIGWGNGAAYMRKFVRVLARPTRDPGFIRDYALVLRNTQVLPSRKVHFYLCGFTEMGTAAAGYFLAANWVQLWEKHVKNQATGPSRGDFCILIEGPSGDLGWIHQGWRQVLEITPQSLNKKRWFGDDCDWAKRMPKVSETRER
jgi:hypothetical protein